MRALGAAVVQQQSLKSAKLFLRKIVYWRFILSGSANQLNWVKCGWQNPRPPRRWAWGAFGVFGSRCRKGKRGVEIPSIIEKVLQDVSE